MVEGKGSRECSQRQRHLGRLQSEHNPERGEGAGKSQETRRANSDQYSQKTEFYREELQGKGQPSPWAGKLRVGGGYTSHIL